MSALGRGRGSWKKPEQLVRQHPGGLLVEHFPVEYERIYGQPLSPDWPTLVEKSPEIVQDNAPGVGDKLLYNSTCANYINQEAENSWVVEVLEVESTANISVRTDDDQVEKCSLCALEDLQADEELTVFLKEMLCQRMFTCHLVTLDDPPSVVLYNGTNNMNLKFAEQTALQAASIQLKEGMSPCVRVTYIADELSFVCVRLTERYFELLTCSLNMVMRLKSETRRKRFAVCKKDLKKLCLLQISNNWYRVSLQSQSSPTEVTVKLVDVGSTVTVDPSSLIALESISAVFSNVPPQAVEVNLNPVHNPVNIHDLLLSSMNKKSGLIMKVLKSDKIRPPVVVFRDPSEKVASPKVVERSFSYQSVGSDVSDLSTSFSTLSLNSPVFEETPKLILGESSQNDNEADVKYWQYLAGKHFTFYVSSATSPLDIKVQLFKNRQALEMLMEMIQEHYESPAATTDDPSELKINSTCAAFVDKKWYRVRIVRFSNNEEVWVHLMDYGNQVLVQVKQIRILPKEYGQEVLPFQSLRAELKGAKEIMSKGQTAAQDVEALLADKTFTCKVWSVESDFLYPACIQVDLPYDTYDSVLDVLYPAAASAC